jgi:hypothetical protein
MSAVRPIASARLRTPRCWKILGAVFLALTIGATQAPDASGQQPPAKPDKTSKSEAKANSSAPSAKASNTASNPDASAAEGADAAPKSPEEQLKEDCANLLKMTRELKAEMDRTPPDTLSLAVVQKARAIEQLSQKIQHEMKAQKAKH